MTLTICPDCDGQKLMHGHDCDCPTCDASGLVTLQSHVGHSLENDTWFVRFYPFGSEEHAKAFEERIQSPIPSLQSSPPVKAAAVDGDWRDKRIAVLEASWQKCAEQLHEVAQERNALEEKLAALASQPAGEGGAVAIKGIRDCLEAIEYASGNCIKEHGQKTINELAKVALSYLDGLRPAAADAGVREWQPIETAPTNKAILIHLPGLDYYGNDGVYAGMLVDMGTGRRWMTFGWGIGRNIGDENAPVAWREIPAASSLSLAAKREQNP